MKFTRFSVIVIISIAVFVLSIFAAKQNKATSRYHSKKELASFQMQIGPIGPGEYFLPSSRCAGCHGKDSLGWANVNEDLVDVNLYDRWSASMMGLSAKDPLWRAKVSHEKLVNPAHGMTLEDKCTSCHAPMGHYNAHYNGASHYLISDFDNDSLGLDGVSCAGCHTIGANGLGTTFSGEIPYDTTRHIYGPFVNPMVGPMQLYTGYTPTYSAHIEDSKVCASCHTLLTHTADLNGNLTGGEFVEQATYHEYKNSVYSQNNTTCQNCHMARIEDPIMIANGYLSLTPRTPFNQHSFAGANAFMLKLIKANKASLGIDVPNFKFDTTLIATNRMLKEKSVDLTLLFDSVANDSAYFRVKLLNKAGHKFPSGYPSRRAILQFVVKDNNNDTVFKSGIFHSDFSVAGENPAFEPHHNTINQSGVSQIYEMVMGDVNSNYTSVLERAATTLKDNRLTPNGFTTSHPSYDTVQISLDALSDPDFNKINGVEGSGTDEVHFHVPIAGVSTTINATARIIYQTLPPKFVAELFSFNSAPIDTFRNMFNAADKTPIIAHADSLMNLQLVTYNANLLNKIDDIKVYPTITFDGRINMNAYGSLEMRELAVFDANGRQVISKRFNGASKLETFVLPKENGIYFLKIYSNKGYFYRKVVKQ
ncbi:MAG TPA: T9SS type A sorting domain-containing protein [Bacteroidia bacterium]|nr:T9SS type A sorting domain-containing protein [Bacteroidia bacterium]